LKFFLIEHRDHTAPTHSVVAVLLRFPLGLKSGQHVAHERSGQTSACAGKASDYRPLERLVKDKRQFIPAAVGENGQR
jgi:hypothetical protein